MIIPYNPLSSYVAISYSTTTYDDLEFFLGEENIVLERIDPTNFFNSTPDPSKLYINLVVKDLMQRQQVTEFIDRNNLSRFSFLHNSVNIATKNIGSGLMFYHHSGTLTNAIIGNDIILGAFSGVAHYTQIGTGTIIDSYSVVAGNSVVGKFCHLHLRSTVYDKVKICDHTIIGAGSFIRKDITESGTYATVINQKMVKIHGSEVIDNG
jgi:acetyltransferase-like isoleucine patch superfamily enzyme